MRRAYIGILSLLFMTLFIQTGCHRRPLEMEYRDGAQVSVVFDWSKSQLDPDGKTVLFYKDGESSPIIKISHRDTVTLWLQVGVYSVIGFNETFEDFDNISFRNTDRFSTIEAYVQEEGTIKATGDIVSAEPDILATAVVGEFFVTADMVEETRTRTNTKIPTKTLSPTLTLLLEPQRVVYPAVVDAYVEGMHNITSAGAYITGFTESIFLGTNKTSIYSTIQKCTFTQQIFDEGSTKNGHLIGNFNCFGLHDEQDMQAISGYTLDFRSVLRDGSLYEQSIVIDKNITTVYIEIGVEIRVQVGSLSPGNNDPIIIPDVEGESGWDIEVGEWEDVVVPIEF